MGLRFNLQDVFGAGLKAFEEFRDSIEAVAISGPDFTRDAQVTISRYADAATDVNTIHSRGVDHLSIWDPSEANADADRYDEYLAVARGAHAWPAAGERANIAVPNKDVTGHKLGGASGMLTGGEALKGVYYDTPTFGDAKEADKQVAAHEALQQQISGPVVWSPTVDTTPPADSNDGITIIREEDLLARMFGSMEFPEGLGKAFLDAFAEAGIITPLGAPVSDENPGKVQLGHDLGGPSGFDVGAFLTGAKILAATSVKFYDADDSAIVATPAQDILDTNPDAISGASFDAMTASTIGGIDMSSLKGVGLTGGAAFLPLGYGLGASAMALGL